MRHHRIALIPGDGIGSEVLTEGRKALVAASERMGDFTLDFVEFDWGCQHYHQHGMMMPSDGLKQLEAFDAIYLGAVGDPSVPDHVSLWGLLLPIRKSFDQYVNLRPIQLLPGAPCPLKGKEPEDIDILFIRENTEGEYAGIGEVVGPGTAEERVTQTSVFTRKGTERIIRYAFHAASSRKQSLVGVTKSNALNYSMVYWDQIFKRVGEEFPRIEQKLIHVDAMAMYLVKNPENFDVIVASNLFGDILTDLGAAIQGGMGFAAGGNINPDRTFPSMFEPIHGSAPDIAGTGQANPIATIWAGCLMLQHLNENVAAEMVMSAIKQVVATKVSLSTHQSGSNFTQYIGQAVVNLMQPQS